MFKKILLIDSYELEAVAEKMGLDYNTYYPLVEELDAVVEDGECIKEYKKKDLQEYRKYYSKCSLEILEKFFELHNVDEFVIVARY